jgi:hypothetical protein
MSETVTTHADGFGNWHATVMFPDTDPEPNYADGSAQRIRSKARQAIRAEIEARGNGQPIRPVRIHYVSTAHNTRAGTRSVTYAESA